jgi:hypothetical protein
MAAGAIDLLGNDSSALLASGLFASRGVTASVDTNSYRRRIEVGLEHQLISITLGRPMVVIP